MPGAVLVLEPRKLVIAQAVLARGDKPLEKDAIPQLRGRVKAQNFALMWVSGPGPVQLRQAANNKLALIGCPKDRGSSRVRYRVSGPGLDKDRGCDHSARGEREG